jgi:hypothetical protein
MHLLTTMRGRLNIRGIEEEIFWVPDKLFGYGKNAAGKQSMIRTLV